MSGLNGSISNTYKKFCLNLESMNYGVKERASTEENIRFMHAVLGIGTEAGELQDAVKKHIFYGKPLDIQNLKEEVGDVCWYINILLDLLGLEWEDVWHANMEKLKARYGDNFTTEKAINRDVEKEKEVLSNQLPKIPRHPDPLRDHIWLAIGEASMCWENPSGAGVFNSSRASKIADELFDYIRRERP